MTVTFWNVFCIHHSLILQFRFRYYNLILDSECIFNFKRFDDYDTTCFDMRKIKY